jgi:predicted TIM-barrel fold metal-dependent hydrolase
MAEQRVQADCHAHVYGGPAYAFNPEARFIPHPSQRGTGRQFRAVLHAHGFTHALVVQAQPYGRDNSAMLDAIAAANGRMKGIGLVDPATPTVELERLKARGMVGLRVNLSSFGLRELQEPGADRLFAAARELGWFLQVHTVKDDLVPAMDLLRRSRMPLLLDHFGRPEIARGIGQPGFQALLELGREGNAVVKLSGPFRCSVQDYPYRDVDPFVEAAIGAFTLSNCIWGSDWPFVPSQERVDYGPVFAPLLRWLPDAADRQIVLAENPARLFGFGREPVTGDLI